MSIVFDGSTVAGIFETATPPPSSTFSLCFFWKHTGALTAFETMCTVFNSTASSFTAGFFEFSADNTQQAIGIDTNASSIKGIGILPDTWYFLAASVQAGAASNAYQKALGQGWTVTSFTADAAFTVGALAVGAECTTNGTNDQNSACSIAGFRFWNGVLLSQHDWELESRSIRAWRTADLWAEWPFENDLDLTSKRGVIGITYGYVTGGGAAHQSPGPPPPVSPWPRIPRPAISPTPYVSTSYPDTVARPRLAALEHLAVSAIPIAPPLRTPGDTTEYLPSYPDMVARPMLAVWQHMAEAAPIAPPVRTPGDTPEYLPWYPESIARPRLAVPEHMAAAMYPLPIAAVMLLDNWLPAFPDRAPGLSPLAISEHLAFADAEELEQIGGAVGPDWAYPDAVTRPPPQPAMPVSTPVQDRPMPLAAVSHPDSVPRPQLARWEMLAATENAPAPERTTPIAWVEYPPSVARPALPLVDQLGATEEEASPERTAPLSWAAGYPDTVARALMPPSQWVAAPAPEQTLPVGWTQYPPTVARPALPPPDQLAVTEEESIPERTSTLWATVYPDTVARAAMPPSVWALHAAPERTAPLVSVVFPDAVARPQLAVWQHLAVTELSPLPIPNAAAPLGVGAFWPDTVARPTLPVVSQAFEALGPSPLATPYGWVGRWPDTVARPALAVPAHMAVAEPQAPDRTTPLADANYPPTVARPALAAPLQQAATELSPLPIAAPVLPEQPSFPDTAPGARLPLWQQWATLATDVAPERTAPIAAAEYPAVTAHPALAPWLQFAMTELPPLPVVAAVLPEQPSFPDVAPGAWTPARQQFAWSTEPAAPERTASVAAVTFPDTVARPALAVVQHLFASEESPLPQPVSPLSWQPIYPATAKGPRLEAWQHPSMLALGPFPLPNLVPPLSWEPYFPDFVPRTRLDTWQHPAVEALWPFPILVPALVLIAPTSPLLALLPATQPIG